MNNRIEVSELSMAYDGRTVLDKINVSLSAGSIVGLLGPNGSGKTTLLKILAGLEKNYTGTVKIDGRVPSVETKAVTAFLPDRNSLPPWMNAEDSVRLYKDFFKDFDEERCRELLGRVQLDTKQPIRMMSKGMQEKLLIVLTMSRKAGVYLLDEPLGGVDPATRDVILNIILDNYREDSLVLISTHQIAEIERIFDRVVVLNEQKIVICEEVDAIRQTEGKSVDELFREVFKC